MLIIARIFKSSGAFLMGGNLVGTFCKGSTDQHASGVQWVFLWVKMVTLIASAV